MGTAHIRAEEAGKLSCVERCGADKSEYESKIYVS